MYRNVLCVLFGACLLCNGLAASSNEYFKINYELDRLLVQQLAKTESSKTALSKKSDEHGEFLDFTVLNSRYGRKQPVKTYGKNVLLNYQDNQEEQPLLELDGETIEYKGSIRKFRVSKLVKSNLGYMSFRSKRRTTPICRFGIANFPKSNGASNFVSRDVYVSHGDQFEISLVARVLHGLDPQWAYYFNVDHLHGLKEKRSHGAIETLECFGIESIEEALEAMQRFFRLQAHELELRV